MLNKNNMVILMCGSSKKPVAFHGASMLLDMASLLIAVCLVVGLISQGAWRIVSPNRYV